MKKNAYIDKAGIMHLVKDIAVAKEFSFNGKVVETEIAEKYGLPLNSEGEGVIVYGPDDMKLDANGENISPIPALADLYKACM